MNDDAPGTCAAQEWSNSTWPNTRVVKYRYYVSQKQNGSIIRFTGTVICSLLYLNSRQGFNGLKYVYSVISVIVDSLPGNTKNRESTRSWTARVRLFHPWASLTETCLCLSVTYIMSDPVSLSVSMFVSIDAAATAGMGTAVWKPQLTYTDSPFSFYLIC